MCVVNYKVLFFRTIVSFALFIFLGEVSRSQETNVAPDEREAQVAAQHFVRKMQETRDISPLLSDFFITDFVSHFSCDDDHLSPSIYSQLTLDERIRLFKVKINGTYLIAVDLVAGGKYSDDTDSDQAFTKILPYRMAKKLRKTIWGKDLELQFSSREDFRKRLPKIENVLTEARAYLKTKHIEQTLKFQKKLDDRILGKGLNYRVTKVRAVDFQGCRALVGFPEKQEYFVVDTPLFLGIVFVKEGNQLKIVRISEADTD